jgi:hypothetical protein
MLLQFILNCLKYFDWNFTELLKKIVGFFRNFLLLQIENSMLNKKNLDSK